MRRIIFLDIDGVLNSRRWLQDMVDGKVQRPTVTIDGREREHQLDVTRIELLNQLVRPGVEWILSSTWRGNGDDWCVREVESILRQLRWAGTFAGCTPVFKTGAGAGVHVDYRPGHGVYPTRGQEIDRWLSKHAGDGDRRIAIIDDDPDVAPLEPWWVEVNEEVGLTEDNVDRALDLLELEISDGEGDAVARAFGGWT